MGKGIEQIGRSKWLVRTSRVNPKTGKRQRRERIVEGTRRDAEAERVKLRHELEIEAPKARLRLGDYATSWLSTRLGVLKASTANKYATALDEHIVPALGDFYIDAIRPSDVAAYVTAKADKLAGYTVLNQLRLLRTIAKDSLAEGVADLDWCARVKAPAVRSYTEEDPNLFTAPELAAFLRHVPEQWLPIVLLITTTGLRWGEASALRWEDVEWEAQEIRVRRTNWKGHIQTTKTAKSRRKVPLLPVVAALLEVHRGRQDASAAAQKPPVAPGEWIFPVGHGARRGKLHLGTPLRKVIDEACLAAGVPRITTHGLRRTFNDIARRLASTLVLQSITGHSTDRMSAHYSLVSPDERADLAARVYALASAEIEEEG